MPVQVNKRLQYRYGTVKTGDKNQ